MAANRMSEDQRLERLLDAKAAEFRGAPEAEATEQASNSDTDPAQVSQPPPPGPTPAAAQGMNAVAAAATQFGQEVFARQVEAWAAMTAAKTPEELAQAQAETGKKVLETYVEHSRRLAGLMKGDG